MEFGEFLTLSTIWISIAGYVIGSLIFAASRQSGQWDSATRILWTIACASLAAHFISAFHFYHGWSHEAAYADTARQTREAFGLDWGGGVFINYALLILWIADVGWWWFSGIDSYRRRPRSLMMAWHGLFVFIIFNATVVFGDGMARWVGLLICVLLVLTWLRSLGWHEVSTTSR